jgi:superfamily II DNA or RNA helicase
VSIEKIREIRNLKEPKLRPSPFLQDRFIDEYGEEHPVVLRDYQKIGILNLCTMPRMILGDDTGLGKAQPIDAKVLTHQEGWVPIGTIRIGDVIIGSDGRPTKVVGIFPQGVKKVYRVIMSDGSSTECCDEHLWTVRTGNTMRLGNGWRTYSLEHIISVGLKRQRGSNGLRWMIPIVKPVRFPEKKLPVDPYLVGALLGDGSMSRRVRRTNGDPEMFELVRQKLPEGCKLGAKTKDGLGQSLIFRAGVKNPLINGLRKIGLMGKNWDTKFIPRLYLEGSIVQREELLRGLMDIDGDVSKDGMTAQFYSSNKLLVDGFVELVQSLGGTAKVKSKTPVLRGKSRAKRKKFAYTITISVPNGVVPFSLSRKVARWRPRTKYFPSRRIAKIEEVGEKECICIKVDAPDNLYVTDNFIITHNTVEVLSAIGYVWLMEPEFVPVVVTKKSSLFQWKEEVQRFMKDMEVIVADGEPYEREAIYRDFFDPKKGAIKRIIVMTYDTLLKDAMPGVVRDYSYKATKGEKATLKKAKKAFKEVAALFKTREETFMNELSMRETVIQEYVKKRLEPRDEGSSVVLQRPSMWTDADEAKFQEVANLLTTRKRAETAVDSAKDIVHPPMKTTGIIDFISTMMKERAGSKLMVVFDEMHVMKNYRGKIHEMGAHLASPAERVVGMTATPVKNRLMEFFGLFRIVHSGLFPKVTHFMNNYCLVKMQKISNGRQVPIVIGHTNEQLDAFVKEIEPYYLNRRKHDVAKDLPELVTRELECELSDEQEELYELAELGMLDKADDPDSNAAAIIGSMVMVQEACDAPQLLADEEGNPYPGKSTKIETIIELLTDELDGVKTLIFSRFERMITLIADELKKNKIKYERITGKENKAAQRTESKNRYQDLKSGINVMLITSAGAESLNLHATEHIIFVDDPWSWGDYVQLTGRAIRIGSLRKVVMATHLNGVRQGGGKTIDHHVLKKLREKKRLADKVAGQSLVGGLQFSEADEAMNIFQSIRAEKLDGNQAKAAIANLKKKRGPSGRKPVVPAAPIPVPTSQSPIDSIDLSDI